MKKLIITSIVSVISLNICLAQNPYDPIGKKTEMLTLSKGKYIEYQVYDSLLRVGTVVLNIRQQKIHSFIEADTSRMPAEVTSRWLAVDPMAHKYPNMSPYVFAANNPIIYVDVDGADIIPIGLKGTTFETTHNDLFANNSIYNIIISDYKKTDKDLYFYVSGQLPKNVEAKTEAIPATKNGKTLNTEIRFSWGSTNESSLGRALLMLHEGIHAYASAQPNAKGGFDATHSIWEKYLPLMTKAVTEYNTDNKLGLNETQIHELSIYGVGPGGKVFDDYVKKQSVLNKTSVETERDNLYIRVYDILKMPEPKK